jgi:hypothetical protein
MYPDVYHDDKLTAAFLVWKWVREHDSSLGHPEKCGTKAKYSPGRDNKSSVLGPVVIEQRAGVQGIGPSSEKNCSDTKDIEG